MIVIPDMVQGHPVTVLERDVARVRVIIRVRSGSKFSIGDRAAWRDVGSQRALAASDLRRNCLQQNCN